MNPRISKQANHALTRFEVLVAVLMTILLFAVLFAMVLPMHEAARRRAERITCVNNLMQVNVALRVWEGDRGRETISIPSGLNSGQKAWIDFMGMSNVLRSTGILKCPSDTEKAPANPAFPVRISYFLNLDAHETNPQMILSGDDNFAITISNAEIDVKPGIVDLSSNAPICWNNERHADTGNIALGDGSVSETGRYSLQRQLQESGLATNRLAIP